MSAAPSLAVRSASLLDASPSLGRFLGVTAAARVGTRPVLPVLSVRAGAWTPPAADALGPETVALAVLEGLLLGVGEARVLYGPGDRIDPWAPATRWTACTDLRLAVVGKAFGDALRDLGVPRWVEKACVPLQAVWSGAGTFEERARALLWWLARRWGTVEIDGIVLPPGVGPRTLAAACDVPQATVAELLARSERLGIVRTRADGSLVLPLPGSGPARERRDELSARIAEQFAVSRLAAGDYLEIVECLDAQHRWSERRRTGGL